MQLLADVHPDKRPATVDLDNPDEIIVFLRALLDLHNLLLRGYDNELEQFIHLLSQHGWGQAQISRYIQLSSYYTRFETLIDAPIPEAGNRRTWNANYHRWRK